MTRETITMYCHRKHRRVSYGRDYFKREHITYPPHKVKVIKQSRPVCPVCGGTLSLRPLPRITLIGNNDRY